MELRKKYLALLTDLKNSNIMQPRFGAIEQTPHKTNVNLTMTEPLPAMKALITGYRSDQETYSQNSTQLNWEQKLEQVLYEELPVITKEDDLLLQALKDHETKTLISPITTPQKRKRDSLQEAIESANVQ
ncbi:hypothetical protein E2C01_052947 [Portunus trituberculatus]|uniref:Uncharacterized protein n=1 Tax=Portunus trituberculatus TaxID=210409 RepID=A0A5B7GQQ3_PORTR|nr:hypothetical protein [Portunus trituberculatus]